MSLLAEPDSHHNAAAAEDAPGAAFGVGEELFWQPDRLVPPDSWAGHVPIAFWLTRLVRPALFVELGTHSGNSYAAFCQAIAWHGLPARAFAVDTWQGDEHAGYYGEEVFNDLRRFNDRHASFSTLLRTTFDDARGYFAEGSIDLLHIDGLHTYEAVRHDFETWRDALSARAVVVLHDTNVRERGFGVWRLWRELAAEHPGFEFFHSHGLGLLGVGPEQPPSLRRLFAAAPDGAPATRLRQAFAARGDTFRWRLRTAEQRAEAEALDRERLRLGTELAQSSAAVAGLEQAVRDGNAALAARDAALRQAQDDAAQQHAAALATRDAALRQAQDAAQQHAAALAAWEGALRRAQEALCQRDAALQRQQEESGAREAAQRQEAGRLAAALAAREREATEALHQARIEAQSAHAQVIAAFRTSTSWRLTAPLRAAARLLHRSPTVLNAVALEAAPPLPGPPVAPAPPEPSPLVEPLLPTAPEPQDPQLESRTQIRAKLAQDMADFLSSPRQLTFIDEGAPLLSILVVVFNQAPFTLMCLRALAAERDMPLELIVVDNASTDDTARVLDRANNIRVLRNATNRGFVEAVNQAAAVARGSVLVLLNNDAVPRPGALAAAVATLRSNADIGAVGGRLVLPDGRLQEAGSIIWRDGTAFGYARGLLPECPEAMFRRDVDFCSGAFLVTPREVFERLGGFDVRYAPAYYEESDYCMRLREAKMRVVYEPSAVVDHFEFASEIHGGAAVALMERNHVLFRQCHATALAGAHLPPGPHNVLLARRAARRARELLVIDDWVPLAELGAGFPRAKQILNRAAALGWGVGCYAMQTVNPDWSVFRAELDPGIEIIADQGSKLIRKFLVDRRGFYDVVLISRPHNMERLVRLLDEQPDLLGGARLVYDAEAVYAHRTAAECVLKGEPMTPDTEQALFDEEIRLAQRADVVLAVSPADAKLLGAVRGVPVHILANTAAATATTRRFAERRSFMFVGRLMEKASPNYDGLSWFVRTVWPLIRARLTDARLVIAGLLCDDPSEIRGPGVELVGKIPDLWEFYEAARVFVAPARFAAGIPLKVLEAAAAGVPVVGSKVLVEQLQWHDGDEILTASDPEQFAEQCCAVFDDSALWQHIRSGALRRIATEYSPNAFEDTLRRVLDGDSKPASAAAIAGPSATPGRPAADSSADAERIARVNVVWGGQNAVWSGEAKQWLSHPLVIERNNKRVSSRPDLDAYGHLKAVLAQLGWDLPVTRAASLCCGTGPLERGLVKQGFVRSIVGYDVASDAIEQARSTAKSQGLAQLSYEVRDLEREGLSEVDLDIVFAQSALHHLARLEECFDAVHAALRPGGVFHVHEYVGPDRFQWTDRQLAEINTFLDRLPERYRRLPSGGLKPAVRRPTIQEVLDDDPSEAIRSSEIEPVLAQRFRIIERRELGGTLLHMALSNITQNFDPDDAEDRRWLTELFDREDQLLVDGVLSSDFIVITAQRTD